MKHRFWIFFSGFVWFAIGAFLLYKGLKLIAESLIQENSLSARMQILFGSKRSGALFLVGLGLLGGLFKGRVVLSKTVRRVAKRILSLPTPIAFKRVYSPSYWILIGSMVALGMSFRFLPIPVDLRGAIDVAIGSALIHGAMLYFRIASQKTVTL